MTKEWRNFVRFGIAVVFFYGKNFNEARLIQGENPSVGEALQFLREYDAEGSDLCFRVNSARWLYSINMTDANKRRMIDEQTLKAKFDKVTWRKAAEFDWSTMPDPVVRRQMRMLLANGRASLPDEKFNELYHLIAEMKDIYGHVRVCPYRSSEEFGAAIYCDLELGDVNRIMAASRDNQELVHIWREWHDKTGPPLKNKFMRYVELANQAARLNGFTDAGEESRFVYDDPDFENELAETFQKIQPLYKELFTYVRTKLYQKYGPDVVRKDGPLPAHILGNVWGQEWVNIFDVVVPYPQFSNFDVTAEMLRQGFTPLRMFQTAEEFYSSLGLKPMPPEFWRFSMIERPNGRKVQCTASAWDFCNKVDFRIKQCTEVNMENLITIHHEMAHIEYYMYYAEQPFIYRDGANPGFHEGIANAIVLSVFNPVHLHRVGLSNESTDVFERNINFLMLMALKKVTYAPFAYLIDQWRYQIYETGVNRMNSDWWNIRLRFQGVAPPVPRTESHFDAASKRHVPADIPYINYYIALLLEFQIHKALCEASGFTGPLYKCDIYRSREAGRILSNIFRVGRARHWKDVIKMLSNGKVSKLSAEPMLEYFQHLLTWLREKNEGETVIGWMTNKEDVALYQPLVYGSGSIHIFRAEFVVIIVYNFLIHNFV
ncbi:angiotensin-converting enzyme-like [Cylas formicarius]|uniref:angiotensin-converting enzyme-like n=1 Tax=Cylas formicarius TaxID=197179 RepID=UPI00295873CB|nr:angiotensin-converting enzyme-like [Cylas formicarius]